MMFPLRAGGGRHIAKPRVSRPTRGRRDRRARPVAGLLAAALPLVGMVVVASDATAATPLVTAASAKVSLFADYGYAGAARDLSPGAYDLRLGQGAPVAAASASSLTVPSGLQATLCAADLTCQIYGPGSYATLTPNDSAAFVVVSYAPGAAPDGLPAGGTVYVDNSLGGASMALASGTSADLYRGPATVPNDSASSVTIKDGTVALLCNDSPAPTVTPTYPVALGQCWTFGTGSSDLPAAANDKASFVAVVATAATNVTLFGNPNLAGGSSSFGPGVYDLTGSAVGLRNTSSAIVPAGLALWLCDGAPGTCRWYPSGTYYTVTPDDAAVTAVVVRNDTRLLPTGATLYGDPGSAGTALTLASGGQVDLTASALANTLSSTNVATGHLLVACPSLPTTPGSSMGTCIQATPGAFNVPAAFDNLAKIVAVGPTAASGGSGATGGPGGTANTPLPAAPEPAPGPRVTLYKDNFSGGSITLGPGVYDATRGELGAVGNDTLSSLVVPAGLTVWLCPDGGTGTDVGVCRVATAGSYAYNSALFNGINDLTSTVVVDAGNGRPGDEGVSAYRDYNFSGAAENFPGGGGYDVSVNGYFNTVGNDAISSLRVNEGYRAFTCQNGIGHSMSSPANCYVWGPGAYPQVSAAYNDIISYIAVYPNVGLEPARVGRWTATTDIGLGVRAGTVLPTGKVLVWETGGSQLFDPITNTAGSAASVPTGHDLFCSTHVLLPNGDVIAAADGGGGNPVKTAAVYSAATNSWTAQANMNIARYYPSALQLSDGGVMVAGGNDVLGKTTGVSNAPIKTPEVFQNGTWRALTNAQIPFSNLRGDTNDSSFWPWLTQTANGTVLYAGPDTGMHLITTAGSGTLTSVGQRDGIVRTYGSYAQYAPGKMLYAGGSGSVSSAGVIDFSSGTPSVSTTGSLNVGRRQANMTLLADGTVLETGGNFNGADQIDHNGTVLSAERWNPATGAWTTLAPMARSRQYHSIALLMPDARVLVAGESQPPYRDTTVQWFSPPYLFNADGTSAARPSITAAPASVGYGTSFSVTTAGGTIAKLNLIKLGSVTHATNFTQRVVPLSFTASGGILSVTSPTNRNLAPPGAYMLFAVNSAGVPSVASIVTLA